MFMSTIKVLPQELVNKIAAGEVVERPASVVKELVENALDAGAKSILVEVEECGKKLIRVTDTGRGMGIEDARLAIVAHATSKIADEGDLFSISTLGFRGEALASIAAVSRFSLMTRRQDVRMGVRLTVENGSIISEENMGMDCGTIIEVCDLFFNTPARRKFMKSDAVELGHIVNVVSQYALVHDGVRFELCHDGKVLLQKPVFEEGKNTIASVYGVAVAKELVAVEYEEEGVVVKGYVGKPYAARNDKNYQALFVNSRWVKNSEVASAVYEGYHAALFVGKHPIFVLNVTVDPMEVDVNIHPQKFEVKFARREEVMRVVATAVGEALGRERLIPEVNVVNEEQLNLGLPNKKWGSGRQEYAFEASRQEELHVGEEEVEYGGVSEQGSDEGEEIFDDNDDVRRTQSRVKRTPTVEKGDDDNQSEGVVSRVPAMKILGQIHKTFFVAEVKGGMMVLDQHAVHERILYEQFMGELMGGGVEVQELLTGQVVDLSVAQKLVCVDQKDFLEELGFVVSDFSGNTVRLESVPEVFGRLLGKELFLAVIEELAGERMGGKNAVTDLKELIVTRMACRAAVMAGEEITVRQMEKFVYELNLKKNPFTCPHGRPTMMMTAKEELEKKFKRKG